MSKCSTVSNKINKSVILNMFHIGIFHMFNYNLILRLCFSGMPWYGQVVQQCSSPTSPGVDESLICGRKYTMQQQAQLKIDIESNNQRGDQSFPLDVAHYLRRTLRFRVPTVQPQEVINPVISN